MKKFFFPGDIHYEKAVERGILSLDALIKAIYKSLCSALRDGVSMLSLIIFLKQRSHEFIRKKRKRPYATSPTLSSTNSPSIQKYQSVA